MELRREEIRSELKRGLKAKGRDLDDLIDRSWDEFLSIIGGIDGWRLDEKKLGEILNRIFQTASPSYPAGSGPVSPPVAGKPESVPASPAGTGEPWEPEELEELEEFEELEEPEESGEAAGNGGAGSVTVAAPLDETLMAAGGIASGKVSPAGTGELEELEELDELEEPGELEELEELGEDAGDGDPAVPAGAGDTLEKAARAEAGELEELDEPAELEELDEEPAELEELDEEPTGESPAGPPPMTGAWINEIARAIEFADSPEEEDPGEDITMNLDIASPFDLMTFETDGESDEPPADPGLNTDTSPSANGEDEKKNSLKVPEDKGEEELEELAVVSETGLEELGDRGGAYIYRPFYVAGFQSPTLLKALPKDPPESAPSGDRPSSGARVIEEREGLHYISDDAFKADKKIEQALNREFKDLVDSVLGEKPAVKAKLDPQFRE
jgi:hypothetical protein